MRLAVPASVCLDMPLGYHKDLSILRQKISIGAKAGYLDKALMANFTLPEGQLVCFKQLSVGDVVSLVDKLHKTEEVVLLTPAPSFDTTPYNNIVMSLTRTDAEFLTCSLNCYGHALAFLIQGAVRFKREYAPTASQLVVYLNALNDGVHTYMVCPRTQVFEPALPFWRGWYSRFFEKATAYQSDGTRWQLCNFRAIGKTVAEAMRTGAHVWIDLYGKDDRGKRIVKQLRAWGLKEQHLTYGQLRYTCRDFPADCALVTVAPQKAQIKKIGEWAVRWE